MDKKPCKILWDVSWEDLMALELTKAGRNQPSSLILHLKNFRRSENFVRIIKCNGEESEGSEPRAVRICSVVRKMWKAYQADMKSLTLKVNFVQMLVSYIINHFLWNYNCGTIFLPQVPSSQRYVHFAWNEADGRELRRSNKSIVRSRELSSPSTSSDERRFVKHSINFTKIWSSEQESRGRCTLSKIKVLQLPQLSSSCDYTSAVVIILKLFYV